MSDNVVRLNGQQVPELGEPIESLIKTLEAVLEHARSGRLQSFVGTGFTADGCRLATWHDTHVNLSEMLGSLAWLQHEYVARKTTEDWSNFP
jgi:hypothetical protein